MKILQQQKQGYRVIEEVVTENDNKRKLEFGQNQTAGQKKREILDQQIAIDDNRIAKKNEKIEGSLHGMNKHVIKSYFGAMK